MHCVVFHNTNAGWGNHSKSAIKAALRLAGFDVTFCPPDERSLMNLNVNEKVDLVVVAGGDGTVAKVVSSLVDRSVPVAILPLGTANNIARSVGVFGTPTDLAESWDLDHWRPLNVGVARGPWGQTRFVEAFGIGPFAKLIKKGANLESQGAAQLRDGRKLLSKIVAKADVLDVRPSPGDGPVGGDLLAIEATSIAYVGPGLKLAEHAKAGDGLLEIVTLAAHQRDAFVDWLASSCEGPPPVTVRFAKEVNLTWRNAPYRIDDAHFSAPAADASAVITLETQPVKVLVRPATSEHPAAR